MRLEGDWWNVIIAGLFMCLSGYGAVNQNREFKEGINFRKRWKAQFWTCWVFTYGIFRWKHPKNPTGHGGLRLRWKIKIRSYVQGPPSPAGNSENVGKKAEPKERRKKNGTQDGNEKEKLYLSIISLKEGQFDLFYILSNTLNSILCRRYSVNVCHLFCWTGKHLIYLEIYFILYLISWLDKKYFLSNIF